MVLKPVTTRQAQKAITFVPLTVTSETKGYSNEICVHAERSFFIVWALRRESMMWMKCSGSNASTSEELPVLV
jgi:hypothetical protein